MWRREKAHGDFGKNAQVIRRSSFVHKTKSNFSILKSHSLDTGPGRMNRPCAKWKRLAQSPEVSPALSSFHNGQRDGSQRGNRGQRKPAQISNRLQCLQLGGETDKLCRTLPFGETVGIVQPLEGDQGWTSMERGGHPWSGVSMRPVHQAPAWITRIDYFFKQKSRSQSYYAPWFFFSLQG